MQTPREFYNLDSIQHRTDWQKHVTWHEQSMFYRVIQPGKNRWNAAFWCGSGSVMRRSALMSVGGIATESVTEDLHTSLRLHAAGWKSVYHDEVLCMGGIGSSGLLVLHDTAVTLGSGGYAGVASRKSDL